MSNGLKLLMLGAGTIITCVVISMAFLLGQQGKELSETSAGYLLEMNQELKEDRIERYNGLQVMGCDVVSFLKDQLSSYSDSESSPLKITVVSSIDPKVTYTYENSKYLTEVQNFSDEHYIRPVSEYFGEVLRNENQVITEVIFTVQ